MRYSVVLVAVLAIPALAYSDTIYVPDDYPTIQGAIDAAVNGDTVLVKPGTYVENIDFKGKAITLTSEQGAGITVIDGNQSGSVVTCQSGEGPDSVLDGFTITNGQNPVGGGMYNESSSPTVTNCTFSGNSAAIPISAYGGGMYNESSSPTVTSCIFESNSSHADGGGMNNESSSPTVTNCTFSENSASNGGGMYNYASSPTVTNCTFLGNRADSEFGSAGGGMLNSGGSPTVINCIFSENSAGSYFGGTGGGMCGELIYPATVSNCTFISNSADYGGGCAIKGDGKITNCILWDNIPDQVEGTGATLTYCCVQGGYPGIGNIDSDPLFVDSANDDYHISFLSPCRGSGDNTAVTAIYDFEGDPRIYQGTVDIGADEFYTHLYVTGDKSPGGAIQGKLVGLPGTNPVGLFIGSGVLPSPIPTMWGEFWLQAPWFLFTLIPIPSNGILELPTTLPGSIPAPYDVPMQALIGLNADSLSNLEVLEVR